MSLYPFDWQTLTALLIVLAAVAVLVRRTWNSVFESSSTGCGSKCNRCPAGSTNSASPIRVTKLVQLDSNRQRNSS